jgi:isoaspartyl peptidase/L-asparaginase-like protein (Ntn-hydrolase superfamily)
MTNRRNFLKTTALATAGVAFQAFNGKSEETEIDINSGKTNKPIVLSTWNFGLQANEAAWEVLKNKGRALDAVEAGVKIPEGDPNERSVGYGGRPDRDGRVTLDASYFRSKNGHGKNASCDVGWRRRFAVCHCTRIQKRKFIVRSIRKRMERMAKNK